MIVFYLLRRRFSDYGTWRLVGLGLLMSGLQLSLVRRYLRV